MQNIIFVRKEKQDMIDIEFAYSYNVCASRAHGECITR